MLLMFKKGHWEDQQENVCMYVYLCLMRNEVETEKCFQMKK